MANTDPRRKLLGVRQPDKTLLKAVDAYEKARTKSPRDALRALDIVRKLCDERSVDVNDLLYDVRVVPRQDFEWATLPQIPIPIPGLNDEPTLDKDGVEVGTSEEFHSKTASKKKEDEAHKARVAAARQARIAGHKKKDGA